MSLSQVDIDLEDLWDDNVILVGDEDAWVPDDGAPLTHTHTLSLSHTLSHPLSRTESHTLLHTLFLAPSLPRSLARSC